MPTRLTRRSFMSAATAASGMAALTALSGCATPPARASRLPRQLVWSTYGVGTGTYNDLAAVANTLTGHMGVQVRLMTSDTGIGRLAPVINGTAQYARAGDEYYYAFEGDDEFASEQWGPQPIRQVWSPPGNYGVLVLADSGIETVSDLEGARYPRLVASTSMNRKLEAILNYGGLTGSDVVPVDLTYGEQIDALRTGHLDALYQNVVGSNIEELASQHEVRWLDLGGDDSSRYETWEELAPMVRPGEFTGAGMEDGETAVNMEYSIPLTTLADRPAEEVSELVRGIDEHFEHFRDATPDAESFGPENVLLDPLVVPFHEGSVEYFRDIGRWTEDLQRRNQALLDREGLLTDAWPSFWERHAGDDDVARRWKDWKRENLPALPEVQDIDEGGQA
ncbi:TAXI family TRAP transporter solute-binding subunit [Nesterenkonia sp. HG001]|uniref:TAXI family TRAP transporter solute-binding subunit n=1 Tax=Nesterenkonia sp. HG001 TaxID=2983207 RepID=UPI002AC5629C|nr:TAXI family TRAP transporter solute-binding subunit [Nesterenkonia sp. HG001]MDZ5077282.1 TAXI family TRAP transporter solute-binding subunit [Nesterenkonia sp. HG001]